MQASVSVSESQSSDQSNELSDDYDDNVSNLNRLITKKNISSTQVVRQLLDQTREKRRIWLKEDISIHEILEKYTCFKQLKWVCLTMFCLQIM